MHSDVKTKAAAMAQIRQRCAFGAAPVGHFEPLAPLTCIENRTIVQVKA
jgi:hypothetical protein